MLATANLAILLSGRTIHFPTAGGTALQYRFAKLPPSHVYHQISISISITQTTITQKQIPTLFPK